MRYKEVPLGFAIWVTQSANKVLETHHFSQNYLSHCSLDIAQFFGVFLRIVPIFFQSFCLIPEILNCQIQSSVISFVPKLSHYLHITLFFPFKLRGGLSGATIPFTFLLQSNKSFSSSALSNLTEFPFRSAFVHDPRLKPSVSSFYPL